MSSDKYFIGLLLHQVYYFPREIAGIILDFTGDIEKIFIILYKKQLDINDCIETKIRIYNNKESIVEYLKYENFTNSEIAHFLFNKKIGIDEVYYEYNVEIINNFYYKFDSRGDPETWLYDEIADDDLTLFNDRRDWLKDVSMLLEFEIKGVKLERTGKLIKKLLALNGITTNIIARKRINDFNGIGICFDVDWKENLQILETMKAAVGKTFMIKIDKHALSVKVKKVL